MKIGKGKLKKDNKGIFYAGTLPFKEGEELVVIREKDAREVLEDKIQLLLMMGRDMPEALYSSVDIKNEKGEKIEEIPSCFPDKIDYHAKNEKIHKLYLDRKIYTPNVKDMMFIRYVSVDEAFEEESDVFELED